MGLVGRRLLILNFAMDEDHPVLGFTASWVNALAAHVSHVDVITGSTGSYSVESNVTVHDANWHPGQDLRNSLGLRALTRQVLSSGDHDAVFTHMAAPYAALVGPDIRLRRIRHVLWYAHASRSKGLLFAYPWVDAIATPTPESCPIRGPKIHVLGHGIDGRLFAPILRTQRRVLSTVHWGRADPIKQIEYLIEAVCEARRLTGAPIEFTQVGSPSTPDARIAWQRISHEFNDSNFLHWIPHVRRSQLPGLSGNYDAFLHAQPGALDKSVLEAASTGLPVLSSNPGVRRELASWGSDPDLTSQICSFAEATLNVRMAFGESQRLDVLARHDLRALARKLLDLLYSS